MGPGSSAGRKKAGTRKKGEEKTLWDLSGSVDESKLQKVIDYLYGVTLGVACATVDEGVAGIEDIDRGAKIGLRWKYGPFELINMVGVAKTLKLVSAVSAKYPSFNVAETLKKQAAA